MITGFIAGVIGASILWFFIWRNNKKTFLTDLEIINTLLPQTAIDKIADILKKYKVLK